MRRTSESDIKREFQRLMRNLDTTKPYVLDYAPLYGGWRIRRISNEFHGVTDITPTRVKTGAFYEGLVIANRFIEDTKRKED